MHVSLARASCITQVDRALRRKPLVCDRLGRAPGTAGEASGDGRLDSKDGQVTVGETLLVSPSK